MSIGNTRHPIPAIVFVCALLAGCGGSDSKRESPSAQRPAAAADSPAAQARAQRVAALPLFDDLGRPMLAAPHLQPADTAARTRNGLYATQAQYDWQLLIAGPYTVLIDVDALGSAEAAMLVAAQAMELRALDPSPERHALSYFVRARQPAQAAAVVNRLADAGFDAVFLLV